MAVSIMLAVLALSATFLSTDSLTGDYCAKRGFYAAEIAKRITVASDGNTEVSVPKDHPDRDIILSLVQSLAGLDGTPEELGAFVEERCRNDAAFR